MKEHQQFYYRLNGTIANTIRLCHNTGVEKSADLPQDADGCTCIPQFSFRPSSD